ncbi:MAG: phosphoribosylanthranilate isomerase [Planctomycetes bacterium]|nr:phosphoribosylanthranilate isomerase [Planctomycetota bacterium]
MSNSTIIKICGCTGKDDARFALQNGADWIGLNLVGGPREIRLADALAILDGLDDPSRAVFLLSVEDETSFDKIIENLKPNGVRRLQLYGHVAPRIIQRAEQQGFETIKVQAIADEDSIRAADEFLSDCATAGPTYLLLDASSERQLGGTGRRANWPVIENAQQKGRLVDWPPQILAGGLNAENVAEALRRVRPAGVDVSSGVESSPGRKDPVKVTAFTEAVRGQR